MTRPEALRVRELIALLAEQPPEAFVNADWKDWDGDVVGVRTLDIGTIVVLEIVAG